MRPQPLLAWDGRLHCIEFFSGVGGSAWITPIRFITTCDDVRQQYIGPPTPQCPHLGFAL